MNWPSRGWRGIYYPHALSRGLAPATLAGVYRQRFQWCLDTMRLFFWDNPLFKSGLSWPQKAHFLIIMMSYLASGLVFPVFYTAPLLVYWRGQSCVLGDELTYGVLRGAYLLATILMFRYLFFGKEPLRQFKMLCSLFPVHAAGHRRGPVLSSGSQTRLPGQQSSALRLAGIMVASGAPFGVHFPAREPAGAGPLARMG